MASEKAYREALTRAAAQIKELQTENQRLQSSEPIAVIGMACRFPGGVTTPAQFWDLLTSGRDAVSDVPPERFDVDACFDPDLEAPGRMYTRRGAFLGDVSGFDAAFFGISPPEAEAMDPQQRLLLEVAWESLENSGLDMTALRGSATGVFLGLCNYDYIQQHVHSGDRERIDAYSAGGVMFSTAAGRLSYHFDFHGPCLSTDTACSSSLVSVHQAIQGLRHGECDLALAGGANLLLSPEHYIALCKVQALAADGHCKPFDNSANGYGRGEGCGMLVLKRLSDAERDHDTVLAVLPGSAVNHDGRSNGLTAPNGPAQQAVIQQALDSADLSAANVQYIEAHGTGTLLGDPIEIQALGRVFGDGRNDATPLLVGSVKSNIGHTEAAAGVAGVIKAVLAVQHGQLPPSLHFEKPNEHIDWDAIPVRVVDTLRDWPETGDAPRAAGVSSFGLSGTNAHVLVAEAPARASELDQSTPSGSELLVLSARSPAALDESCEALLTRLREQRPPLHDVCYTAASRVQFRHRLGIVARNLDELIEQLEKRQADTRRRESGRPDARHPESRQAPSIAGRPGVVFLFTGQGSQYVGMGRSLYAMQPVFRESLDRCDEYLRPLLNWSLVELIQRDDASTSEALQQTALAQPVLVAVACSLVDLWRDWGIEPTAVLGHSVGEIAAAYAAGVLSLEDSLQLAAERGRLMQELPANGGMAAVAASEEQTLELLAPYGSRLCIAAVNAPERVTISGEQDALNECLQQMQRAGIDAQPLHVSHAFHSSLMEPMLAPFKSALKRLHLTAPRIPFYSTVTGQSLSGFELTDAAYWSGQVLAPVRFSAAVKAVIADGHSTFLELGPDTLARLGRQSAPDSDTLWLAALRRGTDDWQQTLQCLGGLYNCGADIRWDRFYAPFPGRKVALPNYPFQRKRFWLDRPQSALPHHPPQSRTKCESPPPPPPPPSPTVTPPDTEHVNYQLPDTRHATIPAEKDSTMKTDERQQQVLRELCQLTGDLLKIEAHEVDPHVLLLEMGADSIVLARARNAIQERFGIEISIRQLFEEYNTLAALATLIAETVPAETTAAAVADDAAGTDPIDETAPTDADDGCADAGTEVEDAAPIACSFPSVFAPSALPIPQLPQRMAPSAAQTPQPPPLAPVAAASAPAVLPGPATGNGVIPTGAGDGWGQIMNQQLQAMQQVVQGQLQLLGQRAGGPPVVPEAARLQVSGSNAVPAVSESFTAPTHQSAPAPAQQPAVTHQPATGQPTVPDPTGCPAPDACAIGADSDRGQTTEPAASTTGTSSLPLWKVDASQSRDLDAQKAAHLDGLMQQYIKRTPTSKKLTAQYRPVLADNRAAAGFRLTTKEMHYPIFARSAKGAYFHDEDGHRYLDVSMGFGVNLFGHNPDFVTEAISEQLERGMFLGPHAQQAGEAAQLVSELTGMERVSFCSTGTESVMTALRAARVATSRRKTVIFQGSYHGHFDGVLAEANGATGGAPGAPGVVPGSVADVVPLEYGSPYAIRTIRELGPDIAAILVEPVQSRRPEFQPVDFLHQLRELANEIGCALIFDEMITGFRTHPGGIQALFGVRADMATYGKVVGGGLPIGVIAGSPRFMDCLDGGVWQYGDDSYPASEMTFYAGTFNKHPLAMAAALAVLKHLKESGPSLQEAVNQRTTRLATTLNDFFKERGVPMQVHYFSSLFRFSFTRNMDLFFYHLLNRGVYVWEGRACFLSTAHTDADLDYLIDAVRQSIEALGAGGVLALRPASSTSSVSTTSPTESPARAPAPATLNKAESLWQQGRANLTRTRENVAPFTRQPVRDMQFGLSFFGAYESDQDGSVYDLLVDSTRFADEHGFSAVWLPERHFNAFGGFSPNPAVLAASLARLTERIQLRAGSVVLPLHHPCRVAEEWALVDRLSNGRAGFACASGWHPNDFVFAPEVFGSHRDVMFERIEQVQRLWSGESLSVRAGTGKDIDVSIYPRPVQSKLPLWLTIVNNPETYMEAGRLGLGVLTNLMGQTIDELAVNIRLYRDSLEEHGHDPDSGHVTVLLHTYVGDDVERVREEARQPFFDYLKAAFGLFKAIARSQGLPSDIDSMSEDDRDFILGKAYERYVTDSALIGTPESCAPIIEELLTRGVDEVGCLVDFGLPSARVLEGLVHLDRLKNQCAGHSARRSGAAAFRASVPADASETTQPLTADQQQLWILAQIDETASVAYHDTTILKLRGCLDRAALESAVNQVVARHDSLRSAIDADPESPRQRIVSALQITIGQVDLSATGTGNGDLEAWTREEGSRPFDLTQFPLYRLHLLRLGPDEHALVLTTHHISIDGWSIAVCLEEIAALYSMAVTGTALSLPEAVQFSEVVEQRIAADVSEETDWWRSHLDPMPAPLQLPGDRPQPSSRSWRGDRLRIPLDAELISAVRRSSGRNGCTLFMTLYSAFATLLYRRSGQHDFVASILSANRPQSRFENVVGYCSNLLPVRVQVDPERPFAEFARGTRDQLLAAFQHELPYGDLLPKLTIERNGNRHALISVVFNADLSLPEPEFRGLDFELLPAPLSYRAFDLSFIIVNAGGELFIEVDYNRDLFDPTTIKTMASEYKTLLSAIVDDPKQSLDSLPLIGSTERQKLIEWNRTDCDWPDAAGQMTFVDLFEQRVREFPEHVAVVCGDRQLTYAELNDRANRLAHYLADAGAANADSNGNGAPAGNRPIAVFLDRSVDVLVALLGVLKSGNVYVPLDPSYPSDRLAAMLEQSRPPLLLTQERLRTSLPASAHSARVVCLDTDGDSIGRCSSDNPRVRIAANDVAYIIFTSGSTGTPKGVQVEHHGLNNLPRAEIPVYDVQPDSRVLQFTSLSFDTSVSVISMALGSGATLDLGPGGKLLPDQQMADYLRRQRITHTTLPPSALAVLPDGPYPDLRCLTVAGEDCPAELVRRWAPGRRFFNAYGPTETTVCVAIAECAADGSRPVIGRPLPNTRIHLLDERLRPVPVGVPGELFISGTGLARGYLNDAALTAERFLDIAVDADGLPAGTDTTGTDAAGPEGAGDSRLRVYRTGDVARWRHDGNIEYVGRIDNQVKLRGFRIELTEIESVLARHPSVREAVVGVCEHDSDRQLVAWFCPTEEDNSATLVADLRAHVKSCLPAWMVPAGFVRLSELPRTPNGKIDRQRLLELPETRDRHETGIPFEEPQTPIEQTLAAVWRDVLGVDRVGLRDDFFALGGDSIKAIQVAGRLQQQGLSVPVADLLRDTTIAELARRASAAAGSPAPIESGPVSGEIGWTPIQKWFFASHPADVQSHYNQVVVLDLDPGFSADRLRTALAAVWDHHDALRSVFPIESGDVRPQILPPGNPPPLEELDLRGRADAETELASYMDTLQEGFDLQTGPLMRVSRCRRDAGDQLLIVLHHLVVDGVSWRILLEDIDTAYAEAAGSDNTVPTLPPRTASYADWSARLADFATDARLLNQATWWQVVEEADSAGIPCDLEHSGNLVGDARAVAMKLSAEDTRGLLTLANAAYQTRPEDLLLVAVARALDGWVDGDCIRVLLEGHGREPIGDDETNLSRTVGWFTSLYPVLLELPQGRPAATHLKSVKESLHRTPQKGAGYGVLRYLTPGDRASVQFAAPPELSVNYLGQFDRDGGSWFRLAEEQFSRTKSPRMPREQLLEIDAIVIDDELTVSITYSEAIHRRETMLALRERLQTALRETISQCLAKPAPERTPVDFCSSDLSLAAYESMLQDLNLSADQVEDILPLSPLQEGILFHAVSEPATAAYFEQFRFRLRGPLDIAVYLESWRRLTARHTALRTMFVPHAADRPLQVVLVHRDPELNSKDLRSLPESDRERQLIELQEQDRQRRFDLQRDPLMRFAVVQIADDCCEVIWSHHHIILDGWSTSVLVEEFTTIYDALVAGRPVELPPPGLFRDYVEWLRDRDTESSALYWEDHLSGYRHLATLPRSAADGTSSTDEADVAYSLAEHSFEFDREDTQNLADWAARTGVTLNTALQGLWAGLLAGLQERPDVVFGTVMSGRPAELARADRTVGLFLNTVPLRVRMDENERFSDVARRIQRDAAEREAHQYDSLADIMAASPLKQNLLDHVLVFENYPMAEQLQSGACPMPAGLTVEDASGFEQMNYDYGVVIHPGKQIEVKFTYDAQRFDGSLFRTLEQQFRAAVPAILNDCLMSTLLEHSPPYDGLPSPSKLVSRRPRKAIVLENAGTIGLAASATVLDLFESRVAATPDAVAVQSYDGTLTYAELSGRADELAAVLHTSGVRRGSLVGLFVSSGLDHIISLLAVHKAGGLFMPLDVDAPRRRLEAVLRRAEPLVLVSRVEHRESLESTCSQIDLPDSLTAVVYLKDHQVDHCRTPAGQPVESPVELPGHSSTISDAERPARDDDAYVIFTSGSTGEPKLIVSSHAGLLHFIEWEIGRFGFDNTVRSSQLAPPTFDVSLRDIFVPLCSGGVLCIPAPETRMHPAHLLDWMATENVTLIHIVPSIFRLLVNELEQPSTGPPSGFAPRHICLAGEPLFGTDVLRWREVMGTGCQLVNLYGPSETTLAKLHFLIPEDWNQADRMLPIGEPITDVSVLLIRDGRAADTGEIGEIHLRTPFPLRGYYHDPERTAEQFIVNPLGDNPGDIIYRTGDLGRLQDDGTVEFIGRLDRQVKLRGIRLELAEVDQAVLSTGLVRQTLATIHQRADGEDVLTCYYTASERISGEQFRSSLAEFLVPAMVPDFFVHMESFPLNLNGKIDRRALPKPEELIYADTEYEPPRDEIETRLENIWQELLALERVGVTTPFLNLGGTSLIALRIVSRVKREFGVDLNIKLFFEQPSIRDLAGHIRAAAPSDAGAEPDQPAMRESIPALPRQEHYAVSHAQRRLWILDRLQLNAKAYSLPAAFLITGPLDTETFSKAWAAVVSRHESLRTTFQEVDGQPRQCIHESDDLTLEVTDLSGNPNAEQSARDLAREEAVAPFDLVNGPLLRARLLRVAPERFLFVVGIHHIVFDGWSIDVMLNDLLAACAAYQSGSTPDWQPLRIQYRDFAAWQTARLSDPATERERSYWLEKFSGELTPLRLPSDAAASQARGFDGARLSRTLDAELTARLKDTARESGASLFMVTVALLKTLLFRYTGQSDIVVGTPMSNRDDLELESQIGLFVNTLALRDSLAADDGFCDVLDKVKQTSTEAFEHRQYPFDRLVEDLSLERDASRHPLFDVMVILQERDRRGFEVGDAAVTEMDDVFPVTCKFQLALEVVEQADGLNLQFEYNSGLFRPDRVARLADHFAAIAESVARDPRQKIADIDYLSDDEQQALLQLGRGAAHPLDSNETIVSRFERTVAATSDHPAVVCESKQLTFAELNRAADRLARSLAHTIERGSIVAVMLERSQSSVVAFLGVLKSGAVYLPVDPEYPAERITWMLEDSQCTAVLTESRFLENSALSGKTVLDIDNLPTGAGGSNGNANGNGNGNVTALPTPGQNDLAYVIYTSGSTGNPKGVVLDHAGAINLANAHTENLSILPTDRILQFAPMSFDASVWEMLMALMRGACLVIADGSRVRDPLRFAAYLREQQVTVATLPPSYIAQLGHNDLTCLRTLVTAGEAARSEDVLRLSRKVCVINAYGPTETTVCATWHEIDSQQTYDSGIPIGRPLINFSIALLDEHGQLVPRGVPGEIHVGGPGLARGYLHRDELTSERFIDRSIGGGDRWYRTGDLGVWNSDGDLEFLGRNDHQVKIRGHRVEPGEIEHALRQEPEVAAAAVIATTPREGSRALAAYFVLTPASDVHPVAVSDLRERLSARLPRHMVPTFWTTLDEMPLLPNGKVDRDALPAPDQPDEFPEDRTLPRTDLERQLASVWQDVLECDRVGVHQNFFELGGDSIVAIQLIGRMHRAGLHVTTEELFQSPTIAELALQVNAAATPLTAHEPVSGRCPLTPIQKWFFTEHQTSRHHFNQAVMLNARERVDQQALRAALGALEDQHASLRLRFEVTPDGTVAEFAPATTPPLLVVDLTDNSDPDLQDIASELQSTLDLEHGPLWSAALVRTAPGDRVLIGIHHLAIDAVSWHVLLDDLIAAYLQAASGQSVELPAPSNSFQQWAAALDTASATQQLRREVPYWTEQDSVPPVSVAPDLEGHNRYGDVEMRTVVLSAEQTDLLLGDANDAYGTEPLDLMLAALARTLTGRITANRGRILLEGHGREQALADLDVSRTVGWFTGLYPLVLDLDAEQDAGRAVKQAKETRRRIPGNGIGYGVLKYLAADIAWETAGPATIGFNYLGWLPAQDDDSAFRLEDAPGQTKAADLERCLHLEFECVVADGCLHVVLAFNSQIHSARTADELLQKYQKYLAELLAHCGSREGREVTPSDVSRVELSLDEFEGLFS